MRSEIIIVNDFHLSQAKAQLALLTSGYHPLQMGVSGPLKLTEKQQEEVQILTNDLVDAIDEYEALKDGTYEPTENKNDFCIEELGAFLIQCRIYKGITQSKMAKQLGMGLIPFQNLESRKYANAILDLVVKAVSILNVDITLVGRFQPDEDE